MTEQFLSVHLRTATERAHEDAEQSPFMVRLMSGEGTVADFTALTAQLHHIYVALEAAVAAHRADPAVAAVHDVRLARAEHLAADLSTLLGDDWTTSPVAVALPATQAYVDRLSSLSQGEQLVAHHYVRYLGDLSGGQIIARLVARHYGVGDDALSFYRFEGIDKPKVYKDEYRAALDSIVLDEQSLAGALAEAVAAFECNRAVFADLEASRLVTT